MSAPDKPRSWRPGERRYWWNHDRAPQMEDARNPPLKATLKGSRRYAKSLYLSINQGLTFARSRQFALCFALMNIRSRRHCEIVGCVLCYVKLVIGRICHGYTRRRRTGKYDSHTANIGSSGGCRAELDRRSSLRLTTNKQQSRIWG